MGKEKGCTIVRKYADFIKSLLKISLDNNKELGVIFCKSDGDVKIGYTSIGTESVVSIPTCPVGQESIGVLHTHVDLDFFSGIDYLSFAAKDDEFNCIAYYGDDGNAYVKCIHQPEDIDKWLDSVKELENLEFETSYAYEMYQVALHDVISAIEEEGELPKARAEIIKALRDRYNEYSNKFEKLRSKSIELEPNACIVKL